MQAGDFVCRSRERRVAVGRVDMKIAFAGFRHGHIWGLYDKVKSTEGISVHGAWEADDAAKAAAMKRIEEPFYDSYDELLAGADAVAIGDYYGIRGQLIIHALRAGKHVISDKPICTSMDELRLIRTIALEKRLKVSCMLDLRYDCAVRAAKKLVEAGKLGKIHAMSFNGQHSLNYGVRPQWYFEEGKHGGVINDIAIHGIDALRYITGLEFVKTNAARTWNAFAKKNPSFKDCAQFMAEFEGGAGLVADVSYAAHPKTAGAMPSYWRFTLWGEEGCAEFRCGDEKMIFASRESETIEEIPCVKTEDDWLSDFLKPYHAAAVKDVLASTEAVLAIQQFADCAQ